MKRSIVNWSVFIALLCVIYACQTNKNLAHSLAGEWNFALDSNDVGEKENWATKSLSERVKLPGS